MNSTQQKSITLQILREELDPAAAAAQFNISRRTVTDLRRRYLRSKLPKIDGDLSGPLHQPVSLRRDQWGVAHIEAKSIADCFTSLGFAMAQDRLWHLDYMRRLANGQLAEILGRKYLRGDQFHRTIGLTRSAREAAGVMSDEVRMVLDAFSTGVNWGIQESWSNLPLEFDVLKYEPELWTPIDSIAIWKWRWWMLTGRLDVIAQREAVSLHLAPHFVDLFWEVEAGEETIVPSREPAQSGGYDTGEGSNNWVVGGSRCVNGKPILATDPHNGVDLSRQWYQAQVTAPGMDAIGAFFMGTPGIYLGHTRETAWGLTNHTASARDLYVESVSEEDSNLYKEGDQWLPFQREQQPIHVRGADSVDCEILRTVRGPLVSEFVPQVDEGPKPTLSLRWVGAEPTTGFESMLALMRSDSTEKVLDALRQWSFPNLNFVFADSENRIGYHAVGTVPKRKVATTGFRPANEANHAWDGVYSFDEMPHLLDPERDWVGSANNPPWGGNGQYLSEGNWADGYRFRRIKERIVERGSHTIESVGSIQADVVLARAQDLAPIVAQITIQGPNRAIRSAGEILKDWDGAYTTDSVGPTVFTAFWKHWVKRVTAAQFPPSVVSLVSGKAGSVARRLLLGEDPGWFPQNTDLAKEVVAAMRDSLDWLRERVGSRRSQWRWGRLHTVTFAHPASENKTLSALLDVGPFETSGGTGVVRSAGASTARPFKVTGLATYRMVVDLADPAHGLATSAGGQSGHIASPNYRLQSELWVKDEYHPLLMDGKDIEQNLLGSLRLLPG